VVKLALFDIDGTLIRTGGAGVKAFVHTLTSVFGVRDATAEIKFGGRTDTSLVREIFRLTDIEHTPENVDRFFGAYVFWLDHLLAHSNQGSACPGVWSFIREVRRLPEPPMIGLLTGNIRLGAEIKLRRYQLWDQFTVGAFGDDDEDRNRIAAIAQMRGSGIYGRPLDGPEVLVVGDTPHDIHCGQAIEARVLAVGTGAATTDQLQDHAPDWVCSSLEEIRAQEVCC